MPERAHAAGETVAALLPQVDRDGHPVRITMLTRTGCHLCDKALKAVECVIAEFHPAVGCATIDVDRVADPARGDLMTRYGDLLPVTFVDGEQHDYWVIDPDRLRQALDKR